MGSTKLGTFGLVWSPDEDIPKVNRIILSRPDISAGQVIVKQQYIGIISSSCAEMDEVVGQIAEAIDGKDIKFDLDIARLDLCPPFQQRVLSAEHQVPRGQITTYQRIAQHLEKPSAARAVGNALANNPFPIIIPCHRAIRSDLTLGGYQGGLEMKHILLEQEDIELDSKMHVINPEFYY
ncbi:methylated-DNA--[protein]-cysteine S-methyltransferase [candidate division KSB1 bacterium]|nr:methylated-DNA--[protein]-cysteine S-methyltransferase [candidate division KSB1 bacterium]